MTITELVLWYVGGCYVMWTVGFGFGLLVRTFERVAEAVT